MKYINIGKLVNTHGIKGEVRIISNFKYKDRVFIPGMKIYIGRDKVCEEINSYRHHKIFEMITIKGYNDINQVLKYKGEYVFVNKDDIILNDFEYLDEDIIGLKVFVDDKYMGVVKKIERYNTNNLLVVKGEVKDYLIPYNFDIIKSVDLEKREMNVVNILGLFD